MTNFFLVKEALRPQSEELNPKHASRGHQASSSHLRPVSLLLGSLVKILSQVLSLLSNERKKGKDEGREGRRGGVRWGRFRSTPLKLKDNFK